MNRPSVEVRPGQVSRVGFGLSVSGDETFDGGGLNNKPIKLASRKEPIMNSNYPHLLHQIVAWVATLLISLLPDILFTELTGSRPEWLFWAKIALLGGLLLTSLLWKPLRGLRLYFTVLSALYWLEWGVDWVYRQAGYTAWFAGMPPFLRELFGTQIPRVTMGALLIGVMWVLTRSFGRFFFVKGRLDAPATPIPFILTRPPSWKVLGPTIAAAMSLGLVAFVFVFGKPPSLQSLQNVLPLLPFVLLFAASNAFGEEMLYRAPWLAALEGPLGSAQALLITAVYFGLGHFYGVPYGVTGVIMAFVPGWLMGKAMIETRGFFWAWLIHICMDTVIFFFMALGSVAPGG
jgi:membrane protease YdiL (CAAX protease family)